MHPRALRAFRIAALAGCAIGLLAAAAWSSVQWGQSPLVAISITTLCTSAALACLSLIAAQPGAATARLGLGPGRLAAPSLALVVVGTLGLSHLLDTASRWLGLHDQSALGYFEDVLIQASAPELLLAAICIGIAPGLGEELFFRGFIMRGLLRPLGSAAAIAFSAVLFGALHLDLVQGGAAVALGVYLGLVALASGSTRAPIACHVANNLAAVLSADLGDLSHHPVVLTASVAALVLAVRALALAIRNPAAASGSDAPQTEEAG